MKREEAQRAICAVLALAWVRFDRKPNADAASLEEFQPYAARLLELARTRRTQDVAAHLSALRTVELGMGADPAADEFAAGVLTYVFREP